MTEPTPETDERTALELRAALMASLRDAAADELKAIKELLKVGWRVGDSSHPKIPDGSPIPPNAATITYKHGAASLAILDQDAKGSVTRGPLFDWVNDHRPEEIEVIERIRPEYVAGIVVANGIPVMPHGDLDVPGVTVTSTAATIQIAPEKTNRAHLFAAFAAVPLRELLAGSDD